MVGGRRAADCGSPRPAAKRSAAWAASTPRSTGSAVRRGLRRVEPGQPEHVLEQPAHPLRLAVDALERTPVPLGVAILRERQARVRLDHRQRRPQLVRGVGRELELSAAGALRAARPLDGRSPPHPGRRSRAGTARSASSPRTIVRCASPTCSIDCATITRSSPTAVPARRSSVPAMVAVVGSIDVVAGSSGSVGVVRAAMDLRRPRRSSTRAAAHRTADPGRVPGRTGQPGGAAVSRRSQAVPNDSPAGGRSAP